MTGSTVADLVGATVARLGVGHAFGVVGSGNFAVTNALRAAGVGFVATRHEGGAATMADAFARTSGQVGVLTVHQGCGLTNAMTGIAEAAKSRSPLLVLAADTAGSAVRSNFRVDTGALAAAVGAVPERVHSAASAVDDVLRAWRTARDGHRTVVLALPLDVQAATGPDVALPAPPAAPLPVRPAAEAVQDLAARLRAARRPVLLAGRGARGAGPLLRELGRRAGALLTTSAVAAGLFEGDDADLGICGGFATDLAAGLVREADLVVAFGCSLTMWTVRHGRLLGDDAVVVQVDHEHDQLGVNRPVHVGIAGDVALTATDVLAELAGTPDATGYRTPDVLARLAAGRHWNDVDTPDLSDGTRIDPRVLSRELDTRLPADRLVAVDSGNFMGYPAAYWRVPDERSFCFTQGFQSIGLGLATLVGAALALPGRLPVLGTGDGGLMMAAAELDTLVRLGIGAVVVVYDDAAYGAEVHHFTGADLGAVTFPDTDIAAVARGYGCEGAVVRSVPDLAALDGWLAGPRDVPLLLDAKIASDGGSWWLAEAFRGH